MWALLKDVELCLNIWWFLDADLNLITRWAAKPYALSGTDEEKYAALHVMASADYASVPWHPVPDRYVVHFSDGSEVRGAFPFVSAWRDDPGRFDEILLVLEAEELRHVPFAGDLARILKMEIVDPFLSVETIVRYNDEGLLGPVLNEETDDVVEEDVDNGEGDQRIVSISEHFPIGPSVFHEFRELPYGLTLAFNRTQLEKSGGEYFLAPLFDAVEEALGIQRAKQPILVAGHVSDELVLVVFGVFTQTGPTKAATALRRFPGYVEEGMQNFDPTEYVPVLRWNGDSVEYLGHEVSWVR